MKSILSLLTVLLAFAVAACTSFPATSFNDRIGVAYTSVGVIYDAVAVAARAGQINEADARNLLKQADVIRDALDIARDLYTAHDAKADGKLAAAIAALNALQHYIASPT